VDRSVIEKGAEMLGVGLDELIEDTIKGMQEVAEAIGLKGNPDKWFYILCPKPAISPAIILSMALSNRTIISFSILINGNSLGSHLFTIAATVAIRVKAVCFFERSRKH